MIKHILSTGLGVLLLASSLTWIDSAAAQPAARQAPRTTLDSALALLARGPPHEACDGPLLAQSRPPPIVAKEPPAPLEELRPDRIPQGNNVQWLRGYWSWDDDSNSFRWVSGLWLDLRVGRQWVPGYWAHLPGGGWQRVPGFWMQSL
jgi:hypothetical protein